MNFSGFLLLVMAVIVMAPAAYAQVFLSALQDVPLAPGLVEMTEQTASFDKPEGRFVEAVAEMGADTSPAEVRSFYAATLPQLGWSADGKDGYKRQSERLFISFETLEGRSYARFELNPGK